MRISLWYLHRSAYELTGASTPKPATNSGNVALRDTVSASKDALRLRRKPDGSNIGKRKPSLRKALTTSTAALSPHVSKVISVRSKK